jgi:transposase-like protein
MTSLDGTVEVLKRDALGRVRTPAGRRRALVEEFGRSGMSGAAFARMAGVKYATFSGWVAKWRRERARDGAGQVVAAGGAIRLLEAEVAGPAHLGREGLVIEFPGGSRVRVESPVQVAMAAQLLEMMGRGRC